MIDDSILISYGRCKNAKLLSHVKTKIGGVPDSVAQTSPKVNKMQTIDLAVATPSIIDSNNKRLDDKNP